jgi:2-amino-4-hydroxy-6-hydroxymethyldihydropteridine diphosphokinase
MRDAIVQIGRVAKIEKVSRVYETAPIGGPPDQPDYLNAAVRILYDGAPLELLDVLQAIETRIGRVRETRWDARVIDLDVLWIEDVAFGSDRLIVPHPRLVERAFAMLPLADVAPDAIDPLYATPYRILAMERGDQSVRVTKLDLNGPS